MYREITHKELVRKSLANIRLAIITSKVYRPSDISKFVFLCGANKSKHEISERRKALLEFSEKQLPHTQFFLAEKMFHTLNEEGHKGNILDVEHLISDFSDYIVIVLESPSAFAELGAFSHNKLRSKLVVINDEQYKNNESFINLGPIKAIEESVSKEHIIHYKMSDDGIFKRDAIGQIYNQIYELFKNPIKSKDSTIDLDSCDPSKKFDKNVAMMVHDIIYITGPVLYKELIEVLKIVFGNSKFNNVKPILAILSSFNSVERNQNGLYRSKRNSTYYDYRFDLDNVISMFRNYMLKKYSERIYEY